MKRCSLAKPLDGGGEENTLSASTSASCVIDLRFVPATLAATTGRGGGSMLLDAEVEEVGAGGAAFAFAIVPGFAVASAVVVVLVVVCIDLLVREFAGVMFELRLLAPPPAAAEDRVAFCFCLGLLAACFVSSLTHSLRTREGWMGGGELP